MVILIALATLVIGFVLGRRIERARWTLPEFDHDYVNKLFSEIDSGLAAMNKIAGTQATQAETVELGQRTTRRVDMLVPDHCEES
jgi:hypothetical protein